MLTVADSLVDELNLKLDGVANELDIRVASLETLIHDCRDKCRSKLDNFKKKFLKLINFSFLKKKSLLFLIFPGKLKLI